MKLYCTVGLTSSCQGTFAMVMLEALESPQYVTPCKYRNTSECQENLLCRVSQSQQWQIPRKDKLFTLNKKGGAWPATVIP